MLYSVSKITYCILDYLAKQDEYLIKSSGTHQRKRQDELIKAEEAFTLPTHPQELSFLPQ